MKHMQGMPIWRDANRLLVAIEQAVRHFPRYHKYTLGTDLRRQAMGVCRLISRAHGAPAGQQARRVERLVHAVDDLKVQIHLGKELEAFRNFKEFQGVAELAVAVGKQSGGWRRHLQGRDG